MKNCFVIVNTLIFHLMQLNAFVIYGLKKLFVSCKPTTFFYVLPTLNQHETCLFGKRNNKEKKVLHLSTYTIFFRLLQETKNFFFSPILVSAALCC